MLAWSRRRRGAAVTQGRVDSAFIEHTSVGRIVIPPEVPSGYAIFYTTIDFEGHLRGDAAAKLMEMVRHRFGIEASLATCNQVHGATVRCAVGSVGCSAAGPPSG